jgi:hypothetical protein
VPWLDKQKMKCGFVFSRWAIGVLTFLLVAVGVSTYNNFFLDVYCGCIAPLESRAVLRTKLLACSTVEQYVDWENSFNITVSPSSEVTGWEVVSPKDPQVPAQLSVVVVRDRNEAVWYPRLSGVGSFIDLVADDDPGHRLMERVRGETAWSPIGAQHIVNLNCLKYGHIKDRDISTKLIIKLNGRWTQLWFRQGAILF